MLSFLATNIFPGTLILGFSLILSLCWLRHRCILLIRNHVEPVTDSRFRFAEVRERLRTDRELDEVHLSLDHDYQVFTYLLGHASRLELPSLKDRLLVLDYNLMDWRYRLTKAAAPEQARKALSEMASVLDILVHRLGEHAGVHTQA